MNKRTVLKLLPQRAAIMAKSIRLRMQAEGLMLEYDTLLRQYSMLQDVSIHEGFPVKVREYDGGHEVRSGCDEVQRWAYATKTPGGKKFTINIYQSNQRGEDGIPIDGYHSKAAALTIMKNWVAFGKRGKC